MAKRGLAWITHIFSIRFLESALILLVQMLDPLFVIFSCPAREIGENKPTYYELVIEISRIEQHEINF
jgi:hypothetical protein